MTPARSKKKKLQINPLGGVLEIGKNMTAYVYDEQILVVDAGLMFPEEEMLGVDIVIPDITYLEQNHDKIVGIVLTHAHEDHIGGLPYVLQRIDTPVYGTRLTLGFVANKLSERGLLAMARLNEVEGGDVITLGKFKVEFVRLAHSVPDATGLIIKTPSARWSRAATSSSIRPQSTVILPTSLAWQGRGKKAFCSSCATQLMWRRAASLPARA